MVLFLRFGFLVVPVILYCATLCLASSNKEDKVVYSAQKPIKYPYSYKGVGGAVYSASQFNGCMLDVLEKTCGVPEKGRIKHLHDDTLNPWVGEIYRNDDILTAPWV